MEEIKERYESLHMNDDDLYDRIEALIERSTLRQEVIAANTRADIANLRTEVTELRGEVKALDAKIDGVEKKLDARIDGVMDAITLTNLRIDDLKTTQSNNMAKWGIIIAVGICAVQIIASVILHFWK